PAVAGTWTTYQPWRDEYRTDFGAPPPSTWDTPRLYFETPTCDPFQVDYTSAQVTGRVMYPTCNGTYQLHFLQCGTPVAWSGTIETTAIITPSCSSYPEGGAADDAGASYEPGPGDGYTVDWDGVPGADSYEVWQDGELIETIPAGGGGPYSAEVPGGTGG